MLTLNLEEIVMHLGPLCDEKKVPYIFINKQNDIGAASGLDVGSAAAAIVKPGKAKETIDDLTKQADRAEGVRFLLWQTMQRQPK